MRTQFLQTRYQVSAVGCLAVLCSFIPSVRAEKARSWTSSDGKTLSASLVSADDDSVILRLRTGREVDVPFTRLSKEDLDFVRKRQKTGQAFSLKSMPEETQAPREIDVEGGPRVFQTPHFEFETDQAVSRGFIAEACRVYEGTYLALNSLPHGLEFSPPAGKTHFRGRFMSDSAFNSIASERMQMIPGQKVVGLYLGQEQELLVPYSSLGAKRLGSRLTLRKSSDTTTLIHEIVHQVMHDWLPLLPTWFSEGMAEYIAAVPYQNGRFEFKNAERGLRERLAGQHRIDGKVISSVKRPSRYFSAAASEDLTPRGDGNPGKTVSDLASSSGTGNVDEWRGTVREYRDAMLTVYFLMHLDDPRKPGAPVGAYLRMVDAAMEDTEQVQADLKKFEEIRVAYNDEVKRFNAELDSFRERVEVYNRRVTQHNDQVRQGVPPGERIEVGEIPKEPVPPKKLAVPESILKAAQGGRIDLVGMVQRTAMPALLRKRSPRQMDAAMREAFAEIGLEIRYSD